MSPVLDAQGQRKTVPAVVAGMIIAFYGTKIPSGWALCDGTAGTPDLRDRMLVAASAVGTGTSGGTASPVTGLTHTGFALANHTDHAVTQPSDHSAHVVTQPATHAAHVATQPATHALHLSAGGHTHDAHTVAASGSVVLAGTKLTGPAAAHSSDGAHTHDAHPAHAGFGVDAHSAHSGFGVDGHSSHSGFAVSAHSAHSITQPDTHAPKHIQLAYIMKL